MCECEPNPFREVNRVAKALRLAGSALRHSEYYVLPAQALIRSLPADERTSLFGEKVEASAATLGIAELLCDPEWRLKLVDALSVNDRRTRSKKGLAT